MKKIERWFYLQLQLMLNMYMRKGNPQFTYEETHTAKASKSIKKFDIKNKTDYNVGSYRKITSVDIVRILNSGK